MNSTSQESIENAEYGISEKEILARTKEKTISLKELEKNLKNLKNLL